MCVCPGIPHFMGINVPKRIVISVIFDLMGDMFLSPMRKQVYKSYRMKCVSTGVCLCVCVCTCICACLSMCVCVCACVCIGLRV